MKRVYDLPLRLLHSALIIGFIGASYFSHAYEDESPQFYLHMLFGLFLIVVWGVRMVWGIVGTETSRWSHFVFHPQQVLSYFKNLLSGKKEEPRFGHHAASSWLGIAVYGWVLSLATTGLLMGTGNGSHLIKEVHEFFANSFLILVGAHLLGVLVHSVRYQDGMFKVMWTGRRAVSQEVESKKGVALIFLGLFIFSSFKIWKGYMPAEKKWEAFGVSLQMGEDEESEDDEHEEHEASGEQED